jgi:hypothetical protein
MHLFYGREPSDTVPDSLLGDDVCITVQPPPSVQLEKSQERHLTGQSRENNNKRG